MYDIKRVKHMLQSGGLALNPALEERILNDKMTEEDHEFLAKAFGTMREIQSEFGKRGPGK